MTSPEQPLAEPTADLVARAKAGDPKAYERLFAGVADRVLLFIRLRLGRALRSRVESVDVLQEAYLEAFRDLGRFEPRDPGAFCRWVCRIAEFRIHGMADHFGAEKRRGPEERRDVLRVLEEARASGHGPVTTMARREGRQRLERALDQLEDEERQTLLLRYFEDRTLDEIAATLGRSATAVRRLLGRAHLHLSDALNREPDER